jgi:hypothetical protein
VSAPRNPGADTVSALAARRADHRPVLRRLRFPVHHREGAGGGTALLLLTKVQERISEWHVLLADRAGAADSAYNAIVGQARDRGLPLYPYTRRTPTSFGSPRPRSWKRRG